MDEWMDDALCAETDPDMFFPIKGGSVLRPMRVCDECDVRAQCLAFAIRNRLWDGIYGGMTPMQRRKVARRAA